MPVIVVANPKGGVGKSTLATNVAGCLAAAGHAVMLGDVDRQQSTLSWVRRRGKLSLPNSVAILGCAVDPRSAMRPSVGVTHVVLDTPGGLRGLDLARMVMAADAILMPVCNSAFDRESAAECHAELMALPRVASGRCKVAVVGMRLDARTKAEAQLQAWAAQHRIAFIGSLRETQGYVRCIEMGLTLFDLPAAKAQADLAQWQPIIDWLGQAWRAAEPAGGAARAPSRPAAATPTPRAAPSPVPPPVPAPALAQRAPALSSDLAPLAVIQPPQTAPRSGIAHRLSRLFAGFKTPS